VKKEITIAVFSTSFFLSSIAWGAAIGTYPKSLHELDVSNQHSLSISPSQSNDSLTDELQIGNKDLYGSLPGIHKGPLTSNELVRVFGITVPKVDFKVRYTEESTRVVEGVVCVEGAFTSYDGVDIPYYQLLPVDFRPETRDYSVVILYSGHGNMDQIAFDHESYQKGLGLTLAQHGFMVFTMENRGMGKLTNLGDHNRLDAIARLTGGSWYGEITSDALYLLQMVTQHSYVSKRVGAGGVSTGGALSLLVGAINRRVIASYVQGYLGSYRTTFGTHSSHDLCNNISGILNHFDMSDVATMIFPRHVMFVNGEYDTFSADDARKAFRQIQTRYSQGGYPSRTQFRVPKNTGHEISTDIALKFFMETLKE